MKPTLLLFLLSHALLFCADQEPATKFSVPQQGYALYYNGEMVGNGKDWNIRQAIANFRLMTETYPKIKVEAKFNNIRTTYLQKVEVLPVFLVPKSGLHPSPSMKSTYLKHLALTQKRYRAMLGNKDTFAIAAQAPLLFESKYTLQQLQSSHQNKSKDAPIILNELMAHFKINRFSCPYIFAVLVMNAESHYPVGGGRPINGGVNTGGGIVLMSSYALERLPYFQSTLQHELGHSFGLVHVDLLGYDMQTSASIMAYNVKHRWDGFKAPTDPGILIPENLKKLAANKLVFPTYTFNDATDIPKDYQMAERIDLNEMDLSEK